MYDSNIDKGRNIVRSLSAFYKVFRLVALSVSAVVLLSSVTLVNAKDNPSSEKQSTHAQVDSVQAISMQGNVRGLERAYLRSDGAIVLPGTLRGKGRVIVDHVVIEGTVSPGNSPGCIDFSGDVTFSSTATLIIEIGGLLPCSEYDRLSITNTLTLNGANFQLALINGFVPQYGDSFDVLEWGALAGGGFSVVDLSSATLPYPLQWDTSLLTLTGEISVGVHMIADGDLAPLGAPDGLVNAADYLIATRLALGELTPGALQYAHGDMNGDSEINTVDLLLIRQIVLP